MSPMAFLRASSPDRVGRFVARITRSRHPAATGLRPGAGSSALRALLVGLSVAGCATPPKASTTLKHAAPSAPPPTLEQVGVSDSTLTGPESKAGGPISLSAAKNEWASFAVRVGNLPAGSAAQALALRLRPLSRRGGGERPDAGEQLRGVPGPAHAGGREPGRLRTPHRPVLLLVRHAPPRLLPVGRGDGLVPFSSLRDPASPMNSDAHPGPGEPVHVWIDLHVPAGAAAGDYEAACDVVEYRQTRSAPGLVADAPDDLRLRPARRTAPPDGEPGELEEPDALLRRPTSRRSRPA